MPSLFCLASSARTVPNATCKLATESPKLIFDLTGGPTSPPVHQSGNRKAVGIPGPAVVMCLLGIIEIFNDTFDEVFTAAQLTQVVKLSISKSLETSREHHYVDLL